MASFAVALPFILGNEGGFSDDPDDRGGRTNFGITQQALKDFWLAHQDLSLPDDVAELTEDEAGVIYHTDYWCFDGMNSQAVATKVFDMAVNMGLRRAIRLLQAALNTNGAALLPDGIYGGKTEVAVNAADPGLLVTQLISSCVGYYKQIAASNPSQGKFLHGWLNRAQSVPQVVQ